MDMVIIIGVILIMAMDMGVTDLLTVHMVMDIALIQAIDTKNHMITGIIGALMGSGVMWMYRQQRIVTLGQHLLASDRELTIVERQIKTQALLQEEMGQSFKALLPDAMRVLTEQASTELNIAGKLITTDLQGHRETILTNIGKVTEGLTDLVSRTSAIDEGLNFLKKNIKKNVKYKIFPTRWAIIQAILSVGGKELLPLMIEIASQGGSYQTWKKNLTSDPLKFYNEHYRT